MSGCLVRIVVAIVVLFSPMSPWPQGILLALLVFEGAWKILITIVRKLDTGRRPTDLHDALGFPVRRVDGA